MRNILTILTFILILQRQALPQLPACKDSFPSSLLVNNSFEDYSGCSADSYLEGGRIDARADYGGITVNNWHSFIHNTWEVNYFNYNCRTNKLGSIFDTTAFQIDKACSYAYPRVPLPLPDGRGFIGVFENDANVNSNESYIGKSYITYCLSQHLYTGQTYLLTFYFGFGTKGLGKCTMGNPTESRGYAGIALFGRKDCLPFPLNNSVKMGCLTNNPGWVQLGQVNLYGHNEWVTGVIEFTPQEDIYCIGIGPDCRNRTGDPDYYQSNSMYYMDKLVLAPVADFSFRKITAISGDACTWHYVLKAPKYGAATYQWYKDGVLIPNAISEIYTVPDKKEAEGNYVVNVGLPYNTCVNSLPFPVTFSELHDFTLGNDTLLCAPTSITLNAGLQTVTNYLWQDGSSQPTLNVDKSGLYWVQLTDNNGCTKKDSINVTVQGCDECSFYVPSAFTPNDDGLNDVFRVKPKCPNIGLQNFTLRIYNRWGQLVFATRDMHKGWNGMYLDKKLDQGVYIYLLDYSFKQKQFLQQKGTIVLLK